MDPKQQAEHLYLNTGKSQKDIAAQLGIDPKTLYRWMKQGHWRELRSATRRMPSVIVENIYAQLDDMNYNIAQRDPGDRHPTHYESLIINRLINSIGKVKKETSQGQNIEFMMSFISWLQPQNDDLAKLLTEYGSAYLKGTPVKGFHPYDIEYGAEEKEEGSDASLASLPGTACPDDISGKQAHDNTNSILPGTPFPLDPNCLLLANCHSGLAEGPGIARHSFSEGGCDSGITILPEFSPQGNDNQHDVSNVPAPEMPEMPEKNIPPDRAATRPCEECMAPWLATAKQPSHETIETQFSTIPLLVDDAPGPADVVSEQGCTTGDSEPTSETELLPPAIGHTAQDTEIPCPLPPETDYTPPTPEERADPQYFVKQYMREQGLDHPDDFQLFSIGEAVYKVHLDKSRKKRK